MRKKEDIKIGDRFRNVIVRASKTISPGWDGTTGWDASAYTFVEWEGKFLAIMRHENGKTAATSTLLDEEFWAKEENPQETAVTAARLAYLERELAERDATLRTVNGTIEVLRENLDKKEQEIVRLRTPSISETRPYVAGELVEFISVSGHYWTEGALYRVVEATGGSPLLETNVSHVDSIAPAVWVRRPTQQKIVEYVRSLRAHGVALTQKAHDAETKLAAVRKLVVDYRSDPASGS